VGAQGGGRQATGAAKGQSSSSDEAAIKQVADAYVKPTLLNCRAPFDARHIRRHLHQYMKLFAGDTTERDLKGYGARNILL
jgi:hypothetical protein